MTTSATEGGEGTGTPAAPAATAPPAAPIVVAAPPTAAPAPIGITSEQLKQRLEETRASTLKEFGFQSIAEGKKAMEAFKQFQQSQLTEQEKAAQRIKELEPFEKSAVEYQTKYAKAVDRAFAKLPPNLQAAIDKQAKNEEGVVNHALRETLMEMFADVGLTAPGGAAAADAQTVATTVATTPVAKPASAAATPPAPKPAATKTKFDEYVEIQKTRPIAAGAFYQAHQRDIEASRPSS